MKSVGAKDEELDAITLDVAWIYLTALFEHVLVHPETQLV